MSPAQIHTHIQAAFHAQDPARRDAVLRLAHEISRLHAIERSKPRALLVGGCVRDLLLGVPSKDIDVEVYGVHPEELEQVVKTIFPGKTHLIGHAFGVINVRLDEGWSIDIAIPRQESKTGRGHTGFSVTGDPTMDVREAARRRDFTINAILFDPLTGEAEDPWNGIADLEERRLRLIDDLHFGEDPLRVYRAGQLVSRFQLTTDERTEKEMAVMTARGDLDELAPERVTEELRKLLLGKKPSAGWELLLRIGVAERYYPELFVLTQTPQDPEWHPEGNVWIHTMMALDRAAVIARKHAPPFSEEERLQILLGTLCHDLGKPMTTKPAPKAGIMHLRSLGHEAAGEEPTKKMLGRLRFSHQTCDATLKATQRHLQPGALFRVAEKENWPEDRYVNAVRKLIRTIHPMSWEVLLAVAEADHQGRALPDALTSFDPVVSRFREVVETHGLNKNPTGTLIRGEDVIKRGIAPGPEVGAIVRAVERARDEGAISTREDAIAYLEKLLDARLKEADL